jgi:ribosomal protein S18 acetylase RimI-like enzyme
VSEGELKLRRYRESDRDAVLELHLLGLKQMGAHPQPGPWDDDIRNIVEHYYQNGGEFLVGEYEGRPATMGAFRKTGPQEAEIKRMRTHPDFQRRGFGQQIYDSLEQKAREQGYTRLHLETGADNTPAQLFYIRNGFVETHRGKVHLDQDSIFYEKFLVNSAK